MIGQSELKLLAAAAGLAGAAIHLAALSAPGWTTCVDDGTEIYPASMIKTPLAVAAAAAVASGRAAWHDRFTVTLENMTPNDAPSPLVPGAATDLRELVSLMLTRSDNVATNLLIDALGREAATSDLAALGFPRTAVRRKLSGALPLIADPQATGRNAHPAQEARELFKRLGLQTLPGAALIAGILAEQYWNTKLSRGLAAGDRFAHKTGDTDEVSHDGGILTLASGERFAIVVYTRLPSNDATDERFGALMHALRPRLLGT
jgi:beta-lactamase class A